MSRRAKIICVVLPFVSQVQLIGKLPIAHVRYIGFLLKSKFILKGEGVCELIVDTDIQFWQPLSIVCRICDDREKLAPREKLGPTVKRLPGSQN